MPVVSIFSKPSQFKPVPLRIVPSTERIVPIDPIEEIVYSHLPTLPPDVIQIIIEFSLPLSFNFDNFRHRAENLSAFATVHLYWQEIAQKLLFTKPVLSCPLSCELFLRALKDHDERLGGDMDGRRLCDMVREVRFGRGMRVRVGNGDNGDNFQDSSCVLKVIQACKVVEKLWINRMKGIELQHFGGASNLRSLFLFDTSIIQRWPLSPPLTPLPALRQLSLRGVNFTNLETALEFFISIPNLATLSIYTMDSAIYLPLLAYILPLPNLHSLSISFDQDIQIPLVDSTIKCLFIRSSSHTRYTPTSLSFPPQLQHLHIEKFADRTTQILFLNFIVTLIEDGPRLAEKIYLAPGFTKKRRIDDDGRGTETDRAIVFAVLELERACGKAGIMVIMGGEEVVGGEPLVHQAFFNKNCFRCD